MAGRAEAFFCLDLLAVVCFFKVLMRSLRLVFGYFFIKKKVTAPRGN
jgi:hypothetical protein